MWLVPSKGLLPYFYFLFLITFPPHSTACTLCIRNSEEADLRTALLPFLLRSCYEKPDFILSSELVEDLIFITRRSCLSVN